MSGSYIEECVKSEVVKEPPLQVIGNGDIFDYEVALRPRGDV